MDTKVKDENIEILISMVMDMLNDDKIDKAKLVRTLFFCICVIAISCGVDVHKLEHILQNMYKRSSIAMGQSSIFPPGEA